MKFVIATGNEGKVREFKRILEPMGFSVSSLKELGLSLDVEETGTSFAENARIKAREACRLTGLAAIADDSGLCVDALHGAPGVLSARYASRNGENASDRDNVEKLLSELKEVPDEKRNASFVCAISAILLRNEENPVELYAAEGSLPGVIARAPRGTNGFGYDPVLYLPEYGKCVAELEPGLKNAVSHRGKALRQLAYRYYGIY